jgi:hypothetical protein
MLFPRLHLAARPGLVVALAVLSLAVTGCQSIAGIQPVSQVRVIDASPDAPALDIYQNSAAGLYNIGFGTVSSYIPISAGTYLHTAYTAGTQQQLASVRGKFSTGSQYTVLAGNFAANLQMTVFKDQTTPAPPGQVALRFLHQGTRAGTVDIYLVPAGSRITGLTPIAAGVSFGGNTGYIDAPSGTYSIVALPAGSIPSSVVTPEYTGSQASYPGGSVRTVVLIDEQPPAARALQTITADDYDPAAS